MEAKHVSARTLRTVQLEGTETELEELRAWLIDAREREDAAERTNGDRAVRPSWAHVKALVEALEAPF